jgi:DNA-3-methyladenine glycosylase
LAEKDVRGGVKLARDFYEQPTVEVARQLLGKYLIRVTDEGILAGMILETEAYVGPEDQASHASRGQTARTQVMFGRAGYAYIYLIYGMHHCLNVVTEREGYPAAVLIRAVEPREGVSLMQARRRTEGTRHLADGPGKICQAFGLDRGLNGVDMCGDTLFIEARDARALDIAVTPRIGVDYAGVWKDRPWRFYVARHPGVSKRSRHPVSCVSAKIR